MLPVRRWFLLAALAAAMLLPAALSAGERGPVAPSTSATAGASRAPSARVIVRFREGSAALRDQAAALKPTASGPRLASTLSQRLSLRLANGRALDTRTQVIHGSGLDSASLARRLAAQADVEWAVVDERRHAYAAPNDPYYSVGPGGSPAVGQWYLKAPSGAVLSSINVEPAWAVTEGSNSVVVAVLDTGIRPEHPDLAGKVLTGYDFVGYGSDDGSAALATANDGNLADADPQDPGDWITAAEDNDSSGDFYHCGQQDTSGHWLGSSSSWHGTQVAGLIGAATNNGVGMAGIGPNINILPVRVLGKCGGYDSDIIAGMRWAAGIGTVAGVPANAHPAKVLNLSLGSSGTCSAAYQSVMADLTAAGKLVVAASGNEGLAVGVPANCAGVIAVGGVRHTGTKVGYSNLGPEVTISAPAGNCVNETGECLYPILTTSNTGTTGPLDSTYTTGGANASLGTSFSTPIVAGTAALIVSAQPGLTNKQVVYALQATARAFPTTGADAGVSVCQAPGATAQDSECYCTTSTCGAGLLDAGAAVQRAASGPFPDIHPSAVSVTAGSSVSLDGSASTAVGGQTIASYAWAVTSGTTLASISAGADASTATLNATGAGTVTVQLTVTDSAGRTGSSQQSLTVTASQTGGGGGSGGGAWSPLWALGLLALMAALPRRRAVAQRSDSGR